MLEGTYGINIIRPREDEDPDRPPTQEELLMAYGCQFHLHNVHIKPFHSTLNQLCYNWPTIMYSLHADMRGFMTAHGQPDQSRSARYVLKDFVCVSAFRLSLPALNCSYEHGDWEMLTSSYLIFCRVNSFTATLHPTSTLTTSSLSMPSLPGRVEELNRLLAMPTNPQKSNG